MNRKMRIGKYGVGCLIALLCTGWLQAQHKSCSLRFVNRVGVSPFSRDSVYTNHFGETFTIRQFKYYISHIQTTDASGQLLQELSDECFLVDAADSASTCLPLSAIDSRARNLRFLVGVDSIKNVTGVHTGVLDPARGMFWTWNTGYVMAKLEGKSAASKAPGNYFTYHIGGYRAGQAAARWVELPLPGNNRSSIEVAANVLQWFNGVHAIRIAIHPVCHEPGSLALQFADNVAGMFSIINQ